LQGLQSQPSGELPVIAIELRGERTHPGLNDRVGLSNGPADVDAFAYGIVIGVCHLFGKVPGEGFHVPIKTVAHGIGDSAIHLEVCEICVSGGGQKLQQLVKLPGRVFYRDGF